MYAFANCFYFWIAIIFNYKICLSLDIEEQETLPRVKRAGCNERECKIDCLKNPWNTKGRCENGGCECYRF